MHAIQLLHNRIQVTCQGIHAKRLSVVFAAVQALIRSRTLSLTALGRHMESKALVKHSIKRMDRLLGNKRLHAERAEIYGAVSQMTLGAAMRPCIIVDWSDLTRSRTWYLLRASIALGGRALTLYEEVHPVAKFTSPAVHREFLEQLKAIVPPGCRPIVITDAGFRCSWFRQVESLGWDWVGRVRNREFFVHVDEDHWRACKSLYSQAKPKPQYIGPVWLVQTRPHPCDLYLVRQKKKGRIHRTCFGQRARNSHSEKIAQRHREPWLLATSLVHRRGMAKKVVKLYQRRMQIEEAFRDIKSSRYGLNFSEAQSGQSVRLEVLLLIGLLATLVALRV